MTLYSDPDYLIHKLRISYLRHGQDRVADRIFQFDSAEDIYKNPYMRMDADDYPEMIYCYSPDLTNLLDDSTRSQIGKNLIVNGNQTNRFSGILQGAGGNRKSIRPKSLAFTPKAGNLLNAERVNKTKRSTLNAAPTNSDEDTEEDVEEAVKEMVFVKRPPRAPPALVVTKASVITAQEEISRQNTISKPSTIDTEDLFNEGNLTSSHSQTRIDSNFDSHSSIKEDNQANTEDEDLESETSLDVQAEKIAANTVVGDSPPRTSIIANIRPGDDKFDFQMALPVKKFLTPLLETTEVGTPPQRSLLNRQSTNEEDLKFTAPLQKKISSLTMMINLRKSATSNPFAADYSNFNGKGDVNSLKLKIYFPHSEQPFKPLDLIIKRTATVEDAIGFALYEYMEQKRQPAISSNRAFIFWWTLRMCEDDGEVDEDFPPLERTRQIEKYQYEEFAVCEASEIHAQELMDQKKASNPMRQTSEANLSDLNGNNGLPLDTASTSKVASNGATSEERLVTIHIHLTPATVQSIQIAVPVSTVLRDVLQKLCLKWKLNWTDYTFKYVENKLEIPLQRKLQSFPSLNQMELSRRPTTTTWANDLFLKSSPSSKNAATISSRSKKPLSFNDFSFTFQRWTVTRKSRGGMAKQERVLTIDGDYIHILPPEHRRMLDNTLKTSSYHINNVVSCEQSRKVPIKFSLMVKKERNVKVYDFQGASEQETTEIVNKVNFLIRLNHGEVSSATGLSGAFSPGFGSSNGGGGGGGGGHSRKRFQSEDNMEELDHLLKGFEWIGGN